jgi:CMP-N,N'-diacetyllegionaminic acid synthase
MKVLALVNARGGSKGVPGKNIRQLAGKPLIVWSIEAGLRSRHISRLLVSTDSPDIAEVARAAGADVPFLRPAELAQDTSLQMDAIRHAISFVEADGDRYDVVTILQPTTPLRTSGDIDGALDLLQQSGADSVISVCDVGGRHPMTCYRCSAGGQLQPLMPANSAGVLRQDFGALLWRNGAIYATRREVLMEQSSLYGQSTFGYAMPEERSFNIDTLFDWDLTEGYIRLLQSRGASI